MENSKNHYYVPEYSKLPFFGALGLFCLGYGSLNLLHINWVGMIIFLGGALILAGVMFGWFREVIREQMAGHYNEQITRSFQWGMVWFIFAEIFLFGIFFAPLLYAKYISVPALAGYGSSQNLLTNIILWPNFKAAWPLFNNPNAVSYPGATGNINTWSTPIVNTIILILSCVTILWSYRGLKRDARVSLITGLLITIILGIIFALFQVHDAVLANNIYSLKLSSGIYGSTFFMLVGLHIAHVVIGILILLVMLLRILKGHFTKEDHFAFKASVWFWQFITIIWLFIFVFVYWV